MNSLKRLVVVVMAVFLVAAPVAASAQQIIYTLCQWYDADRNCYKCSDYFSVRSQAEAEKRCKGATPYYFPSVGAMQAWKISNCTCDHDD
ncbi:MAG: hypothetical protein RDU20_07825 [Desulfomonilaceae bacterium]|nr:hypothetical protein [Desulfomonilaceae bacterium]